MYNSNKQGVLMKNYNSLLLAGAVFASFAHARNAIKLGQYITGNYVDQEGRTLLHKFAQHSCGKKFVVKFDAFDFFENKLPAEIPKLKNKLEPLIMLAQYSPELAMHLTGEIIVVHAIKFTNQKDNDGNTALDLARIARQEAINNGETPHDRNELLINALEALEPKNEASIELVAID